VDTIAAYTTATKQVCNQSFTAVQQFFTPHGAGSIYDGLQVGIKHGTTAGFTGGLAYTFSRTKNSTEGPFTYPNKPFLANIKDEWSNGTDDQRHSLTVNGEYKWKYGLALSSLYRFGSGTAYATITGTAAPNGAPASFNRTVAANTTPVAPGTTCAAAPCLTVYAPLSHFHYDAGYGYYILDRNSLRGRPIQRVDSRLQETIPVHERYKVILAVEAFNLFNHSNYGNYVTSANLATYGNPASTSGNPVEFAARQLQFIGRFQF
jgi:hypothetical protein